METNDQTDVIVIGGGGSGLAAAVAAAEAGNQVTLIEKNALLGGTTARSIGSISASGTAHQRKLGIVDSAEHHYEDMAKFPNQFSTRPDNDELRRILTDNVTGTIAWLCSMGVEFFGPLEEPPHRKPRMHNVLPGSRSYIFHLEKRARAIGARITTDARATRFITQGRRVTGVEFVMGSEAPRALTARKAVILASGDYSASASMKKELISDDVAAIDPVNPANTGDGLRMALELGARITNGDMYGGGLRFVPPPKRSVISDIPPWNWLMHLTNMTMNALPRLILTKFLMGFLTTVLVPSQKLFAAGAILVNRSGQRFVEEKGKRMFFELSEQPERTGYIILDDKLAEQFSKPPYYVSTAPGFAYAFIPDYRANRPDLFHSASTLSELAARISADALLFEQTINQCNSDRSANPSLGPLIDRPPYYALGPARNYVNYTDGGLSIDSQFRVLGAGNTPIEGLYAVGSAGQGGLLLRGHGNHLGWAFTSGRLAGASTATAAAPVTSTAQ